MSNLNIDMFDIYGGLVDKISKPASNGSIV